MRKYKSIFISDLHLGTKHSKAKEFLAFFKEVNAENIYFVGDIIDGWAMKHRVRWKQSHSDVIQKILRSARKGNNIYYITGNHDNFLRPFLPLLLGNNLQILNDLDYYGIDGKRYLVIHGDIFDSMTITKKWLTSLGDKGYDILLNLNPIINHLIRLFGVKRYWSLSYEVKNSLRDKLNYIENYENLSTKYAKRLGYNGVICGHIHKANIKAIDNIIYMNSGDWIESCTALAERLDGSWEIINWLELKN